VRTLPIDQVLLTSRNPYVLRPRLQSGQVQEFLARLEGFIGYRYSLSNLFLVFGDLVLKNIGQWKSVLSSISRDSHLENNLICTDCILGSLSQCSEPIRQSLQNNSACLDYGTKTSGSLLDFVRLEKIEPK